MASNRYPRPARAGREHQRDSQKGLKNSVRGHSASWKGLNAPKGLNRGAYGCWTCEQNFFLFHRTLFTPRAAALLAPDTFQHQKSRARQPVTS